MSNETFDAVEMVRDIRDKHYEDIKNLSFEEQMEFNRKRHDRFTESFDKWKREQKDNNSPAR